MEHPVFPAVEALTGEYTKLWIALCMRETRSDDFAALNAQTDALEAFGLARGLRPERISYPAAGDALILTLPARGVPEDAAPVALLGHMDTVHAKGVFGDPPVQRAAGRLCGPGVCDMKGGVVTALLAMDALRQSGLPHREVRLILNPDEESGEHIGMEARRRLFEDNTRGCVAAVNCESGVEGHLTVGRKGVLRVAVDVEGVGAHAGNEYFKGASAVREAAKKLLELERRSVEGGLTFNCGRIEGGTVVNIVPTACHMEFDIRFLTRAMLDEALEIVKTVTETSYVPGTRASFRVLHLLPAMEKTEGNLALFGRIAAFAAKYGLETFSPLVRGGGSDSAFPAAIGVPTVCSMGVTGDGVHTVREWAAPESLPRRAKILAGVLSEL